MYRTALRPRSRSTRFAPVPAMAQAENAWHPEASLSRIPARAAPVVQPKLKIGAIDDPAELAADRVADAVMRMPEPVGVAVGLGGAAPGDPADGSVIRRKCAACSEDENESIRRKPAPAPSAPPAELGLGPGKPLPAAERAFFEPRFGQNFSTVRIHTDAAAGLSARSIDARAYALGRNIVFGDGEYRPEADAGKRLIAHELAHVEQSARNQTSRTIVRRQPDAKGPHTQPDEAVLRVRIVITLESVKKGAIDRVMIAIESGDRKYLGGLGLKSKQIDDLIRKSAQFDLSFGTAAELAVENAVRSDAFLSQYVKRGPIGRVPSGVGKPDWTIETASSRIPVDLMTPDQVAEKLRMWRAQSRRGRPKWYVEKGLNVTYDKPGGLKTPKPPPTAPVAAATGSAVKSSTPAMKAELPMIASQVISSATAPGTLVALVSGGASLHPSAQRPAVPNLSATPNPVIPPKRRSPPSNPGSTGTAGKPTRPVRVASPGLTPAQRSALGNSSSLAFSALHASMFGSIQNAEVEKASAKLDELQTRIDALLEGGYSVQLVLIVEKPDIPDVLCWGGIHCDSGQLVYFHDLFINYVEKHSIAPAPSPPRTLNQQVAYAPEGYRGQIVYPHEGGSSYFNKHDLKNRQAKHRDHHLEYGTHTIYPPPILDFKLPNSPPIRLPKADPFKMGKCERD